MVWTIIPLENLKGSGRPALSPEQRDTRMQCLQDSVEYYLPGFLAETKPGDIAIVHQDAFASGYDIGEYTLLGMAIKYAGLKGVELLITGGNGETYGPRDRA